MLDAPGKTKALKAALRVRGWVRDRLLTDVCEVGDDGPSLVGSVRHGQERPFATGTAESYAGCQMFDQMPGS